MGQLLRIIIILIGLWLVLQIIKRALTARQSPSPNSSPIAKMISCDHCGVHVPESEAIRDDNNLYCCEEHRKTTKPRDN